MFYYFMMYIKKLLNYIKCSPDWQETDALGLSYHIVDGEA